MYQLTSDIQLQYNGSTIANSTTLTFRETDGEAEALAFDCLNSCFKVRSIVFRKISATPDFIQKMSNLTIWDDLSSFSAEGCIIPTDSFKALCYHLQSAVNLNLLHFSSCQLKADDMEYLHSVVRSVQDLRIFNANLEPLNRPTTRSSHFLSFILKNCVNLCSLDLSRNNLSDVQLCHILAEIPSTLRRLEIGDENFVGARTYRALKRFTHLRDLRIRWSQMSNPNAMELAASISAMNDLRMLDLSSGFMKPRAVATIANAIVRYWIPVSHLDISGSGYMNAHDWDAVLLIPTLKYLYAFNTNLDHRCPVNLQSLMSHTALRFINLGPLTPAQQTIFQQNNFHPSPALQGYFRRHDDLPTDESSDSSYSSNDDLLIDKVPTDESADSSHSQSNDDLPHSEDASPNDGCSLS